MRSLFLGPVFHCVASAPAIVVFPAASRSEIAHVALEQRSQIRNAGNDVLGQLDRVCEGSRRTYSDIEFNSSPQNQHRRVSISEGHTVNLRQTQDRADGREQTQEEETHHTRLLRGFDIQL